MYIHANECIHVHTLAYTHTHNIYTTSCAPCTHIEMEREKCPWWMLVIEHMNELPEANACILVFINVHMHTYRHTHTYAYTLTHVAICHLHVLAWNVH